MEQQYMICVTQEKDIGYCAKNYAFDIELIGFDNAKDAVNALKGVITSKANSMLADGKELPDEDIYFDSAKEKNVVMTVLWEKDFEADFKKEASQDMTSTRRTVSLPKYMDTMIRNSDMDASKLFQEAVTAYFEKEEYQITSVEELKRKVDQKILDRYCLMRLKDLLIQNIEEEE